MLLQIHIQCRISIILCIFLLFQMLDPPPAFFQFEDSCRRLQSANISMLTIFNPHLSANARQSSLRAIDPDKSSFTSSQSTPPGTCPVIRHKSTPASVCPILVNTPPSRARNGTMCPGREKSEAWTLGEISCRTVSARSCAEMPDRQEYRPHHSDILKT